MMHGAVARLLLFAALSTAVTAVRVEGQVGVRREEAQFVASSRGQVYYSIGCDGWKRLSPANLFFFRTSAAADAAGYRPSQARGCAPQLDTALIVARPGGTADCVISRIIDGDTFQCEGGSRVRLLIVDADETGQSVYADSATLLLTRIMPVGSNVRLEFDVQIYDQYRRILAYVHTTDVFINRELVRRGLAQVAVHPPNVRHVDLIRAAADSARHERLGVWSRSAFECSPADYRAGRCRQSAEIGSASLDPNGDAARRRSHCNGLIR
jgi:micrococcal nuclease